MIVSKAIHDSLNDYLASVYPEADAEQLYNYKRCFWVGCAMYLKHQGKAVDNADGDKEYFGDVALAFRMEVEAGLISVLDDYQDVSLN